MAHSQQPGGRYAGASYPATRNLHAEFEDDLTPDYDKEERGSAVGARYARSQPERLARSYGEVAEFPADEGMALYRGDQGYGGDGGLDNAAFRSSHHARNDSGQYDNDFSRDYPPDPRGESYPDPRAQSYPDPRAQSYPDPRAENYPDPRAENYPDPRAQSYPDDGYGRGYTGPYTEDDRYAEEGFPAGRYSPEPGMDREGMQYHLRNGGDMNNHSEPGVGLRYRKHNQDYGQDRATTSYGGEDDRISLESIDLQRQVLRASTRGKVPSKNLLATLRVQRTSRRRRRSLKIRHSLEAEDSEDEDNDENEDEVGMPSLHRKKPQTLQERLEKARREHNVEEQAEALRDQQGALGSLKRQGKKTWLQSRSKVKDWLYQFELWAGSFKDIEGRFGSATVSYFIFVRWLLFLNLFMFLIMFLVIVVPFLALPKAAIFEQNSTSNASEIQQAVQCSREYETQIKILVEGEQTTDKVLDFVTGTGWMERTVLFYGFYYNNTVDDSDEDNGAPEVYNMGLAYLLAVGICFLASFLLILRSAARTVKESVLSQESSNVSFNNKVFCGWDFCISDDKSAERRFLSLVYELKRDLREQRLDMERALMTTKDKAKLYLLRLVINVVVFAILGVTLYLIYFTSDQLKKVGNQDLDNAVKLLVQYLPSITITVLNFIIPLVFAKIVLWEKYTPSTELRITLVRTVLLRLSSLAILVINLFIQFFNEDLEVRCGVRENALNVSCWETYFGQQFYKLTLVDFAAVLVLTFLVEFPRKLVVDRYNRFKLVKLVGVQEFDLPVCVLDIVYTQSLCWYGMLFSPLIPAITLLKVILIFYMKKLSLLANCDPPARAYQASRSKSFFMTVLLLSFLLSVVPVGYIISKITPSQSCGPFRVHSRADFDMFTVLTLNIETWPQVAREIFLFIGTPGFLIPIIILLCLLMYYYWASSEGNKKKAKLLKEQLKLEGKDKQFLLARVNEVYKRDLAPAAGAMAN